MNKREDEDMEIDAPDEDVEMWIDEDDDEPPRSWFGRRKAGAHAAWRKYVDTNIPAEDDADDSLPVFLRGHRGRLIFGVTTMLMLSAWAFAVASLVV